MKSVNESDPSAKQGIMINTANKWIAENDQQLTELNMTTWLCYDKANHDQVSTPKCFICIYFQDKLWSHKNFNTAFIAESKNLWTSSFKDYAASNMH